jgi:hypothetical protein
MSTTEPPLVDRRGRPDDDLDGLLRSFFQAEMPSPWPSAPVPAVNATANGHAALPFVPPVRPAQPWRMTSRLALAASLGGLLVGTLLLSGQFQGNQQSEQPTNLGSGSGDRTIPAKMKESLEQPPDGPTSLRIDIF